MTSDNQFGFKRNSSCAKAVYTLRSVVDHYVSFGSTVNMCSIDLSKAFDKMNHNGLFTKLMEKTFQSICSHYLNAGLRWVRLVLNGVKLSQALLTYYAVSDKAEYYPRISLLSLSTVSLTRLNQAAWAATLNGHVWVYFFTLTISYYMRHRLHHFSSYYSSVNMNCIRWIWP